MNIGLDMMGGDFAPLEAVKGVKLFLASIGEQPDSSRERSGELKLTLFGDQPQIEALLKEHNVPQDHIKIVHTSQVLSLIHI